jgi:hypothetical protein
MGCVPGARENVEKPFFFKGEKKFGKKMKKKNWAKKLYSSSTAFHWL